MNNRRKLVIALGMGAVGWTIAVFGQSQQVPIVIGWLTANSSAVDSGVRASFKEGLAALGWKEGSQFVIEQRFADGRTDQLLLLAGDLEAKKPALIVTGSAQATAAATKAAPKTPVVMALGADPVIAGFAVSLARPGGMVTGLSNMTADVTEKYLELLLAAAPKVKRVGVLIDSKNPTRASLKKAVQRSAAQRSVDAHFVEVVSPEEIESAFSRLAKEGVQALIVVSSAFFGTERQRIVNLALARRWPVIAYERSWTEEGALMSYGPDVYNNYRRAATIVDRILKGAKPGEIPFEQPTKFVFDINRKTAHALGLKINPELLLRADKVFE